MGSNIGVEDRAKVKLLERQNQTLRDENQRLREAFLAGFQLLQDFELSDIVNYKQEVVHKLKSERKDYLDDHYELRKQAGYDQREARIQAALARQKERGDVQR